MGRGAGAAAAALPGGGGGGGGGSAGGAFLPLETSLPSGGWATWQCSAVVAAAGLQLPSWPQTYSVASNCHGHGRGLLLLLLRRQSHPSAWN